MSSSLTISYGVPLRIYIGPNFVCGIHQQAPSKSAKVINWHVRSDNTSIYYSDSSTDIIKQVRQNDLNKIEKWLASNRLILNQNKPKRMLFATRQKLNIVQTMEYNSMGKKLKEYQELVT